MTQLFLFVEKQFITFTAGGPVKNMANFLKEGCFKSKEKI